MPRSQVLKNLSFNKRMSENGTGKMKTYVLMALMAIAGVAVISQSRVVNVSVEHSNSQPSLLEVVPRSLFAEIEEQSKSLTEGITTTLGYATGASATAVDPGKYPPFSCEKLLQDLKTDPTIQKQDPNLSKIYARKTVTDIPFYISVHNKTFDATRWDLIVYGFYYERKLTKAFFDVLEKSPPGARVLDVGGKGDMHNQMKLCLKTR